MAQRITRWTTNPEIAGSNPARFEKLFFFLELVETRFIKKNAPPGGLEPPTFRLTAERASQLRHGGWIENLAQGTHVKENGDPYQRNKLFLYPLPDLRYGLVVRIPGSHPGGPGSIPGNGKFSQNFTFSFNLETLKTKLRRRWDSNPRGQSPLD